MVTDPISVPRTIRRGTRRIGNRERRRLTTHNLVASSAEANFVMRCIFVPFRSAWTALLLKTAGWVLLLSSEA
jgi:hypothetical protein